jgi:hypothetical protein
MLRPCLKNNNKNVLEGYSEELLSSSEYSNESFLEVAM